MSLLKRVQDILTGRKSRERLEADIRELSVDRDDPDLSAEVRRKYTDKFYKLQNQYMHKYGHYYRPPKH